MQKAEPWDDADSAVWAPVKSRPSTESQVWMDLGIEGVVKKSSTDLKLEGKLWEEGQGKSKQERICTNWKKIWLKIWRRHSQTQDVCRLRPHFERRGWTQGDLLLQKASQHAHVDPMALFCVKCNVLRLSHTFSSLSYWMGLNTPPFIYTLSCWIKSGAIACVL